MRLCYDLPRLPGTNVGQLLFALAICCNISTLALAQGDNYPQQYPRAKPTGVSSGAFAQQRQQQRGEVNSAAKEISNSASHSSPVPGSQGRAIALPTPYQAPRYVMPQQGLPEEEPVVGTTAKERISAAGNRRVK